jgi:peptide-methionine (S)-S-oxide reductase
MDDRLNGEVHGREGTPVSEMQVATFGGGCFWCLEAVFSGLKGVSTVQSGYSGGAKPNPTYREICTGTTGHAEVVQIHFDPSVIAYRDLLEVFFHTHDPTTLNRQGGDVGTQYRSVIYYHTPEQQHQAEGLMAEFTRSKTWPSALVTEVAPIATFYPAEEYHRDYYLRNSSEPYCRAVIAPKMAKLRSKFEVKLSI